jgi:predicted RNase H-like HicB family nuclease
MRMTGGEPMKVRVIVHTVPETDGGGYWAEVPALPGCATQGETFEELQHNVREAIEGWVDVPAEATAPDQVIELAV